MYIYRFAVNKSYSLGGGEVISVHQSAPSEVLIRFRSRPDIPTKVSWA